MALGVERLSELQAELLQEWFAGAEVVSDLSWGRTRTTVLEFLHQGDRYVAKAGGPHDRDVGREIRAHRRWLSPWTSVERAPALLAADEGARLLVTRFLPGTVVERTPHALLPDTYRQAGRLLAQLHGQLEVQDAGFEARENEKALLWLRKSHGIEPKTAARLRWMVESWPGVPSTVVPTHGDWQPRNWLVCRGRVSVIDFGRTDLRPALTDFTRLAAQQFRTRPELESAFIEGYGSDPREPAAWRRARIREAIGTAVWAHNAGDERFEQQGHRMIAEALDDA